MSTIKTEIHKMVDLLPEDATYEDLMEALYVRIKFEKGKTSAQMGLGVPTEKAREIAKEWLK